MLQYSTHFLFSSKIIQQLFHFILSDQLEKLFSVCHIRTLLRYNVIVNKHGGQLCIYNGYS